MKMIELHMRIIKNMEIIEFHVRIKKIIKINVLYLENLENHENIKIPCENHESYFKS